MSTTAIKVFNPFPQSTIKVTANTGASPVALPNTLHPREYQVRIRNTDSEDIWFNFGDATVTATIPTNATGASFGVGAGATEVFTVTGTHVAVIAAGTPSVEITVGFGA